ncbi:MAG TPA: glycosyltransferase, partial [Ramlibacter sp.]
ASWTGAIASRLAGVPHVWHLRELPLREHPGEPIFGRRLERRLLSDPRCVLVCNSGFVRDWYQGTFGRAPAVAYQPVSVPSVAARAARSGVHVAVLGRLHPAKRQHLVVEAVARLPAELRERLQVHLHGEPIEPYATQLQALVDARGLQATVHLHGFTPSPHQALADCDLVVLPSVGEAFGRACAEAMLLGVPVIGADSGGTLELIGAAGSKGRLFRTDDADALSACIASFLRDPAPFRQRAAAARDWAREALAEDAYLETLRSAFASARGK